MVKKGMRMKTYETVAGLFAVVFLFTLSAAASDPVVVGTRGFQTIGTNGVDETVTTPLLIEGTLRKVGAGALTVPLSNVFSADGRIEVCDGSLNLTADGTGLTADIPTNILAKAAFWVDANTNVVVCSTNLVACYTNGADVVYITNIFDNAVAQWLDVREPDAQPPYQYLRGVGQANFTNALPEYAANGAGPNGNLARLYFGGAHNGRWMEWRDPTNGTKYLDLYNVFIVHGAPKSYGFVLSVSTTNTAVLSPFHHSAIASTQTGLEGVICDPASSSLFTKTGRTFLNRRRIDGSATQPIPGDQLLEVEAGVCDTAAQADTFFGYRNYFATNDNRIGGDYLCEVLVFTNRLTETERIRAEHYLWQKWFSTAPQAPTVSVFNGLTSQVSVVSEAVQTLRTEGDGTVVKSGDGRLLADDTAQTETFDGDVRLDAGSLDLRVPLAVLASNGVRYVSNTNVVMTAVASAGQIVKAGDGELVLRSVPSGVAGISVESGLLQIAQAVAKQAQPANAVGTFLNPSFELFPSTGNYYLGSNSSGNFVTSNGWTCSGAVKIASDQWSGLLPYPAPDGKNVMILKQYAAAAETTFNLSADGVYALSFRLSGRVGQYQEVDVLIDGVRTASALSLPTEYRLCRYRLPWLAAGDHTLRIKNQTADDWAAAVDDFRLDFLSPVQPLNVMTNPSFEATGYYSSSTVVFAPTNTGWTFDTSAGNVYVAGAGSAYCPALDFGRRVLILQNMGKVSTTMTFPEAGPYRLSFKVGQLPASASHLVDVSVGGVSVGKLSANVWGFKEVLTDPFTVAANTPVTLVLAGERTAASAYSINIDDITVVKYGESGLIQNGGFENGTNGWVFIQDPTATKTLSEILVYSAATEYYGTNVFEGLYRLKLCDSGLAKQTVTFDTPGTYRLVCHANSREVGWYGVNPIAVWVARACVTNTIGYIKTYDRTFRRHAFLFSVPEAGDYEIGFEGQTPWILNGSGTGGVYDRTSLIDNVSVKKVTIAALGTPIPKDTALDVADGARLILNYVGTVPVATVRYKGQRLTGTISHATCPEFVYGMGKIYSAPKGTLIRLQ
jgi:hypothetical protein